MLYLLCTSLGGVCSVISFDVYYSPAVESCRMNSKYNAGTVAMIVVVLVVTAIIVWLSVSLSGFNNEWYQNLNKPPGVVPNGVFGIAWTILYILIVIGAVYAVIVASSTEKKVTIVILYTLALLLTLMWVVSFNLFQQPPVGLAVLLLTLVTVGCLLFQLFPGKLRSEGGKWDYFPAVAFTLLFTWLLVASYYNLGIVALNPGGGAVQTSCL